MSDAVPNSKMNVPESNSGSPKKAILIHLKGFLVLYSASYLLSIIPPLAYPWYLVPWFSLLILWSCSFIKQGTAKGMYALGIPSGLMQVLGRWVLWDLGNVLLYAISCIALSLVLVRFTPLWNKISQPSSASART